MLTLRVLNNLRTKLFRLSSHFLLYFCYFFPHKYGLKVLVSVQALIEEFNVIDCGPIGAPRSAKWSLDESFGNRSRCGWLSSQEESLTVSRIHSPSPCLVYLQLSLCSLIFGFTPGVPTSFSLRSPSLWASDVRPATPTRCPVVKFLLTTTIHRCWVSEEVIQGVQPVTSSSLWWSRWPTGVESLLKVSTVELNSFLSPVILNNIF